MRHVNQSASSRTKHMTSSTREAWFLNKPFLASEIVRRRSFQKLLPGIQVRNAIRDFAGHVESFKDQASEDTSQVEISAPGSTCRSDIHPRILAGLVWRFGKHWKTMKKPWDSLMNLHFPFKRCCSVIDTRNTSSAWASSLCVKKWWELHAIWRKNTIHNCFFGYCIHHNVIASVAGEIAFFFFFIIIIMIIIISISSSSSNRILWVTSCWFLRLQQGSATWILSWERLQETVAVAFSAGLGWSFLLLTLCCGPMMTIV